MSRKTYMVFVADFTLTPGPRYIEQGKWSGEKFRRSVLERAFEHHQHVTVNLDGTAGYGSSFLDEAFGGLIRERVLAPDEVSGRLEIVSEEDESYRQEVLEAMEDAGPLERVA